MSHQCEEIPNDLLSNSKKGNYSLLLSTNQNGYNETLDVKTVKNLVSYHMRTDQMAFENLQADLKVFEEYSNFDQKDINTFKTKQKIIDGIDL
jgi:hypothetical protein